ncbi:response regulator [Rheinheimera mesophila]|uniref:Response regulator n=1 Tax=Rheinheimera mesophila TaxID=1547515 RepID=A0A3P3QGT8_9GAMM|nr:response regulator [Rheinheimera mesophila]KKL02163.1 chemotaxis protein CheY [Rheinheimera mesophila]RRJ20338.1 response regulator [Rheinheimera mesophila]
MNPLLLIDDDRELTSMLSTYLQREGFEVQVANDSQQGLRKAISGHYELLVLDVMMPGLDGISLLRQIRQHSNMPVIMLTAKGDDIDKVLGLELGADDYVAKPCLPRELVARIRAILRRVQQQQDEPVEVRVGPLTLDPGSRKAWVNGQTVQLTGAEFSVLWVLACQAGRLVSKAELSLQALGKTLTQYDRSLDVHISNIRQKLGKREGDQAWIEAVRGKGYQLMHRY